MNAPDFWKLPPPPRPQPACFALVLLSLGICADRLLPTPTTLWLGGLFLSAAGWLLARRRPRPRVMLLCTCLSVGCFGGALHHQYWFDRAHNDVQRLASNTSEPVVLRARLLTRPAARASLNSVPGGRPSVVRTHCVIRCETLENPALRDEPVSVCGNARLVVSGNLLHVQPDDTIRIHGHLSRIAGPDNPGEFDFRNFMRGRKIDCSVFADHPDAVERISPAPWWSIRKRLTSVRDQAHVILDQQLDASTLSVAVALLLGNRALLQGDQRDEFIESGTMHLLAISGLHVGILAWLVVLLCRFFDLSPGNMAIVLICTLVSYAALTEARPSVVRATILICLAVWGRRQIRSVDLRNSLWVTGILLLIWNPTGLFDVGTQLSFLSVTGISLALSRQPAFEFAWLAGPILQFTLRDRVHALLSGVARQILIGYWMMLGITLLTAPVVAARFGVVSVAGMLLNVLLLPLMTPVIWFGFATLFCGFLLPFAAPLVGTGFQWGLQLLLEIIHVVARISWGHFYVPAIPNLWIVGFYILIGVLAVSLWVNVTMRKIAVIVQVILLWFITGLCMPLISNPSAELRVCFLSVGHGLSVVVTTPDNHCLLYDCGCINSATRAERVAEGALRTLGVRTLDAVLISHADSDHYNGVAALLNRYPVGSLLINEATARENVPAMLPVFAVAHRENVPVCVLQQGDRFNFADVSMRVLHPPPGNQFEAMSDNATSLVLEIQFGERRVLLTGDLENEGLQNLLNQPRRGCDIVLAPHHGSARANPPQLRSWCGARFVVASRGRNDSPVVLKPEETNIVIKSTSDSGAITFRMKKTGPIFVKEFHPAEM